MKTLLLDQTSWDLVLDVSGNIALAADPYAQAQDVASAIRLFAGELWFNKLKGIPYWAEILGLRPPLAYIRAQVVKAALTVPGIVAARCIIVSFVNRRVSGQVQVTDAAGAVRNIIF